ncbi:unnamed protein product [Ambrosiozyma monospora]|uniref:Unnamed protein product n=1 Tax=Ambrosiozyma monospora TaxID=43982 RepID=A0A9W7DID3_AMBMO|nr:unnamed protein product [Ambrosiozyma monospora]
MVPPLRTDDQRYSTLPEMNYQQTYQGTSIPQGQPQEQPALPSINQIIPATARSTLVREKEVNVVRLEEEITVSDVLASSPGVEKLDIKFYSLPIEHTSGPVCFRKEDKELKKAIGLSANVEHEEETVRSQQPAKKKQKFEKAAKFTATGVYESKKSVDQLPGYRFNFDVPVSDLHYRVDYKAMEKQKVLELSFEDRPIAAKIFNYQKPSSFCSYCNMVHGKGEPPFIKSSDGKLGFNEKYMKKCYKGLRYVVVRPKPDGYGYIKLYKDVPVVYFENAHLSLLAVNELTKQDAIVVFTREHTFILLPETATHKAFKEYMKEENWIRDKLVGHPYGYQQDPGAPIQVDKLTSELSFMDIRLLQQKDAEEHVREFAGMDHFRKTHGNRLLANSARIMPEIEQPSVDFSEDSPFVDPNVDLDKIETVSPDVKTYKVNKIDVSRIEEPKFEYFDNPIYQIHRAFAHWSYRDLRARKQV